MFQASCPSGHSFYSPRIQGILRMRSAAPLPTFLPSATEQKLAAFPFFCTGLQPFLTPCTRPPQQQTLQTHKQVELLLHTSGTLEQQNRARPAG